MARSRPFTSAADTAAARRCHAQCEQHYSCRACAGGS